MADLRIATPGEKGFSIFTSRRPPSAGIMQGTHRFICIHLRLYWPATDRQDRWCCCQEREEGEPSRITAGVVVGRVGQGCVWGWGWGGGCLALDGKPLIPAVSY